MFDIGGWEFLIVIVIAIIVIGPKDIPGTIRTVTGWVRKARGLAREFQSGLDDLARESEIDTVKNDIQSGLGLDEVANAENSIRHEIESAIDPDGEIKDTFGDYDPREDTDFGGEEDLDDYGPPPDRLTRDDSVEGAVTPEPVSDENVESVEKSPTEATEKA